MRAKSAPMLTKAGRDITKAKINFRIPLAPLIIRNIRPILKTLATRNNVGEMDMFFKASSNPETETKIVVINLCYLYTSSGFCSAMFNC